MSRSDKTVVMNMILMIVHPSKGCRPKAKETVHARLDFKLALSRNDILLLLLYPRITKPGRPRERVSEYRDQAVGCIGASTGTDIAPWTPGFNGLYLHKSRDGRSGGV